MGREEVSCLWSPQLPASSHGGAEHWAGGRRPGGSGRRRPSGGGHWAPRRGCRAGCGADPPPGFSPPPMSDPAPRLIQGFILRHAPRCPENAFFVDHVRTSFLLNLRRQLPRNILDTSWPTPPPALREVRGLSLLTGGPPTHLAEGPNNHVTRGSMGREGTWSWATESEFFAEKQFRNGRVVQV